MRETGNFSVKKGANVTEKSSLQNKAVEKRSLRGGFVTTAGLSSFSVYNTGASRSQFNPVRAESQPRRTSGHVFWRRL